MKGKAYAVSPTNLRVAENVTLILPLHRESMRSGSLPTQATAIALRGAHRPGL